MLPYIRIPAGFTLLPAINEDGWAGFLFIGSFPGVTLNTVVKKFGKTQEEATEGGMGGED